ncbi:MAG: HAMP domain-containing sensor histidine kinase [Bacteroidota bacterium]
MKTTQVYIIVGFMLVAVLGIIVIQVRQLQEALELSEENFNASVNDALNKVVDKLEGEVMRTQFISVSRQFNVRVPQEDPLSTGKINTRAPEGDNPLRQQRVVITDSLAIVTEKEAFIPVDSVFTAGGSLSYVYRFGEDTLDEEDMKVEFRGHPRAIQLVSSALSSFEDMPMPKVHGYDTLMLDSMIQMELFNQGIFLDYGFKVAELNEEQGQAQQNAQKRAVRALTTQQHRVQMFPNMKVEEPNFLEVYFTGERMFQMRQVWTQAGVALLFTLIILLSFGFTLRVIFRQKRLSEMKTDFINNMTHELKTPIATISLATDAINNPRVQATEGGIERYAGIIKEENQRMHRQVERVLLAAQMDRNKVTLREEQVDIHQILEAATQGVQLQVKEKGGEVELHLRALQTVVQGDREHLSNVIYNLLDNARKYSSAAPRITIRTWNKGDNIKIAVEDCGIGIKKADLPHIFTRFFRVSTGNLHDVKGFGLGLSYVKEITEAHEGHVQVDSIWGHGSTFTLTLPTIQKD